MKNVDKEWIGQIGVCIQILNHCEVKYMRQFSKLFQKTCLCDKSTARQLNDFLEERPNYIVDKVSFENPRGTCIENLFVVFKIKED